MILLATIAAAAVASDPALARITQRAESCISANAADVERAEPSLAQAATFLLDDVCAIPVSAREHYEWSAMMLASMRRAGPPEVDEEGEILDAKAAERMKVVAAKQRSVYERATINEETGDIVLPPDASQLGGFVLSSGAARSDVGPQLRAFAAKALLGARKARIGIR